MTPTSPSRSPAGGAPRAVLGLLAPVFFVCTLAAGCGGSSGDSSTILPDGAGAPRAYTERYLRENPGSVLRLTHLLIADVSAGEAPDRFAYQVDADSWLRLEVEPDAAVDTLVLRDARGVEVCRSGNGGSMLSPGRHHLEIQPQSGTAAPTTVFVRPIALDTGGVVLRASKNCVNCDFCAAQLDGQNFDGIDLSGSYFLEASISDSTFRGTTMVDCNLSGEVMPTFIGSCDFGGANLTGAQFNWTNVGQGTIFGGPAPTPPANLSNTSWGGVLVVDDTIATGLIEDATFANATLAGAKLSGVQLNGVDLRGADLSGANFTASGTLVIGGPVQTQCTLCDFSVEPSTGNATNFTNAILSTAGVNPLLIDSTSDLSGAHLQGAQLPGMVLSGMSFTGADLGSANLDGAQLDGADLRRASLNEATLDRAVLDDAELGGATFAGASFAQASLKRVNLYAQDLHGLTFSGASMIGAILDYADLEGADLSGAVFGVPEGSTEEPASMIAVYMPNVDLTGADLRGVDLTEAHLYGDLSQTSLNGALLDNATLVNAICSGAQFTQASLSGAVLDGAQLVNCGFTGADLSDASLDTTYLQGADFSGAATVAGIRLSNAAVSTAPGTWTFTEQNGMPFVYSYGATVLGAIATESDVICPDGNSGPCIGDKLQPVTNGPFPPVPTCVPQPPNYNNCSAPPAPPTPTPPP